MSANIALRALGVFAVWSLTLAPAISSAQAPQGANTGDGSTPFTGLAQAPEANLFVGAATLAVPIEVPPGRGAMTPSLALTYNSSAKQSPFGYGWSLPIGTIQRCLKRGVPSCHDSTYRNDFVLELPSGTVECTLAADGRCYPQIEESFLRIEYRSGNNSWEVRDRDGNRYTFGDVSTARTGSAVGSLFVPAVPSSPTQLYVPCKYTFSWGLTRVEDPRGNDINIVYVSTLGVLYPQRITYGGNPGAGVAAMFDVAFSWEDYTFRGPLTASAGFAAEISKRLDFIEVRYQGALVRRYDASFWPLFTSDDEQQFLQDVMLSSAEGPLLNSAQQPARTSFFYQRDDEDPPVSAFGPAQHAPVFLPDDPSRLRIENRTLTVSGVVRDVLDMNGDGIVDLVDMHGCTDPWDVYLGSAAGFATTPIQWSVPDCSFIRLTDTAGGRGDVSVQAFDIDGDSIPDLVDGLHACIGFNCDYSYWRVYRGRVGVGEQGWGFEDTYVVWPKPAELEDIYMRRGGLYHVASLAGWGNPTVSQRDLIDMNADGLVDLVSTETGAWKVWLNTGAGFEAATIEFPAPYPFLRLTSNDGDEMVGVYDINGDGLPDQVVGCDRDRYQDCPRGPYGGPLWEVYLNTGHGMRMTPDQWSFATTTLKAGIRRVQGQRVVRDLFDMNGDGLPDVVEVRADNHWDVYLNGGFDFRLQQAVWVVGSNRIRDANTDGLTEKDTFDIDGDGLVDFIDFDHNLNDAPSAVVIRRGVAGAWCASSDGVTCATAAGGSTVAANPDAGPPAALVQVENGIGGTTYLEYRPSTEWDNRDDSGVPRLPLPLWTLTAIESDDGLCDASGGNCIGVPGASHSLRSEFRYSGGLYHHRSREFRGFAAVERRDAAGNLTTTRFHQDAVRRGKVEVVQRFAADPVDPYQRPIDEAVQLWQCADLDDGTDWPCPEGLLEQPMWVRRIGDVTEVFSNFSLSSSQWRLTTRYGWQQCGGEFTGEATQAGSLTSDSRVVLTQTDYACAPSTHILGKPIHSVTRDGSDSATLEERWFFYDGDGAGNPLAYGLVERGLVTRVESWLDMPSALIASTPCTAAPGSFCTRTSARYDGLGNVIERRDANGRATLIQYDAASHYLYPSLTTNAAGHKIGTGYDIGCGKLEWQTLAYVAPLAPGDPSHPRMRRRYDSYCRLERTAQADEDLETSPHEVFVYLLGAIQQPTAMKAFRIEPYFSETHSPQSPEGQALPHSHYHGVTTLTDALGRPIQRLRRAVVDGQLVSVAAVTMSYDDRGLLARQHVPFPASGVSQFATPAASVGSDRYVHDAIGRVVEQTNPDGGTRRWNRSIAWQTTAEDECYADASCAGGKTVERNDADGRVVERSVYAQNGSGEVLAARTRYAYDILGRLRSSEQWNGNDWAPATKIAHTYDSLGRRLTLDDPDSGRWRYGYDAVGNLRWQDDPKAEQHLQFCYDAVDRVTKKYVFTNVDFDGALTTCGFGATVEYEYDDAGDPNGIGRLAVVEDPSGSTWFQYDVRGRVTAVNKGVAVLHDPPMQDAPAEWALFQYSYDAADHISSIRYPDGEIVAYGYDLTGSLKRLESDGGKVYLTDLTYDIFGRRRRIVHGDGTVDERTYSADAGNGYRLSAMTTAKGSAKYLDIAYSGYTRTGLITRIDDRAHPSPTDPLSGTVTYDYDGLGRLIGAAGHNLPAAPNDRYAYDSLGNMVRKEARTFTYDATHPHQLRKIDGKPNGIAHDENGSRISKPGQAYAYDPEGRLARIGGGAVEIQYDYSGRQVAKYVAASAERTRYFSELAESRDGALTKYYLAGDLRIASRRNEVWHVASSVGETTSTMLASTRASGAVKAAIGYDVAAASLAFTAIVGLLGAPGRRRRGVGMSIRPGQVLLLIGIWLSATLPAPLLSYAPFGVRPAAAGEPGPCTTCTPDPTTHYHVDHLGSVLLVSRAGAVSEQIRYKPYGGVRLRQSGTGAVVSPTAHPYEFTGYETDATSGLQYAGARFYDPELGSFLSHDPQRQFPSPYAYGSWNPVNGVDPDGEFFFLIPVLTVALEALTAVLSAVQALLTPLLTQLQPAVVAAAKGAATGFLGGSIEAISTGDPEAILEGIKNGAIAGAVSGLIFDSSGLGEALDGVAGKTTLTMSDFSPPSIGLVDKAAEVGIRGALAGSIRGTVGALGVAAIEGGHLGDRVLAGLGGGAIGGAFGNLFQPTVDHISQAAVGPFTNGVAETLGVANSVDPGTETFGSLLRGGLARHAAGGALAEAHRGVGKFLKRGLSRFGDFQPRDLTSGAAGGAGERAEALFLDQGQRFYDHHVAPILESPLVRR